MLIKEAVVDGSVFGTLFELADVSSEALSGGRPDCLIREAASGPVKDGEAALEPVEDAEATWEPVRVSKAAW